MDREINACLYDILNAIEEIEQFLPPGQRLFEIYQNDLKTKRAIERNLEIIGEATNRILVKDSNFHISNHRKIIGLRNRIIHGYDKVSDELVWGIIVNELPGLKAEISNYL